MPWDLRGHTGPRAVLRASSAHAFLLAGPEGVGRRPLARWFSAWLNCDAAGNEPCGTCKACRAWAGGSHPDYLEVASARVTAQGRVNRRPEIRIGQLVAREGESDEPLSTWLSRRPVNRHRVAVLDGADRLTLPAANSFLKMLEEPPGWARIVLIAPARHSLLPTIASRVTTLQLATVTGDPDSPAGHPALELGTPGPLLRALAEPAQWQDTEDAVEDYLAACAQGLGEALASVSAFEKAWLDPDMHDVPGLLVARLRERLHPEAFAAADDAVLRCEELLGAYVTSSVALTGLTLELTGLLSS